MRAEFYYPPSHRHIRKSFSYADKALRASVRLIEELQRNFEMRAEF